MEPYGIGLLTDLRTKHNVIDTQNLYSPYFKNNMKLATHRNIPLISVIEAPLDKDDLSNELLEELRNTLNRITEQPRGMFSNIEQKSDGTIFFNALPTALDSIERNWFERFRYLTWNTVQDLVNRSGLSEGETPKQLFYDEDTRGFAINVGTTIAKVRPSGLNNDFTRDFAREGFYLDSLAFYSINPTTGLCENVLSSVRL